MTEWADTVLWRSPVPYGLCVSEADYKALDPEGFFLSPQNAAETKQVTLQGTQHIVVCIRPTDARTDIDTLVHEAVHVFQHICEYVGEEIPGEEQEAYGIEAIFSNLYTQYLRQVTHGS